MIMIICRDRANVHREAKEILDAERLPSSSRHRCDTLSDLHRGSLGTITHLLLLTSVVIVVVLELRERWGALELGQLEVQSHFSSRGRFVEGSKV